MTLFLNIMSATPSSELDSSTPPSHAPIVLRRDGHGSLLALPRQHLGRTFSVSRVDLLRGEKMTELTRLLSNNAAKL